MHFEDCSGLDVTLETMKDEEELVTSVCQFSKARLIGPDLAVTVYKIVELLKKTFLSARVNYFSLLADVLADSRK